MINSPDTNNGGLTTMISSPQKTSSKHMGSSDMKLPTFNMGNASNDEEVIC